MGYVSTGMGDRLSALLVSLMALQHTLVDRNPFRPCSFRIQINAIIPMKQTCDLEDSNIFFIIKATFLRTLRPVVRIC